MREKMAPSAKVRKLALAAGLVIALPSILQKTQDEISNLAHTKLRGNNNRSSARNSLRQTTVQSTKRRKEVRIVRRVPRRQLPALNGLGGEPDSDYFPLQECEGDCDEDDDVS